MPVAPTYPGVYLQELPSQFRAITGVATSVAAFVDWFPRGPLDEAVQVFSWADFERSFGGLHSRSEASFAVDQFFRNGGTNAWIVRVTNNATILTAATKAGASTTANGDGTGGTALAFEANQPGTWGNNVRLIVEPGSTASRFNLLFREFVVAGGASIVLREERYNDLNRTANDPNEVANVLRSFGAMARITGTASALIPAASGTISLPITSATLAIADHTMTVTLNSPSTAPDTRTLDLGLAAFASIDELAARLQGALRSALPSGGLNPGRVEFSQAEVKIFGSQLQILPGTGSDHNVWFEFPILPVASPLASALGINSVVRQNIAAYQLGGTTARGQITPIIGADGDLPRVQDLVGSEAMNPHTGMYALNLADTINLVCIPRVSRFRGLLPVADNFTDNQFDAAISSFTTYCERRRAVLLLDAPDVHTTPSQIRTFINAHSGLRHRNAAMFYPRLIVGDPFRNFQERSVGASGAIAGICASTDAVRGVWKAPAGTEARIRGLTRLETRLTDPENGTLNPIGVNCLRTFDLYGHVNWGARTLVGVDDAPDQWKFLPVRRLALFLEETLFRSTQWVVHEPNDEPLWSQIRLSVGAFMNDLFHKGAFQGQTKQQAYFVRCDASTTTPFDQERGIVNLTVGFAPLKPAEFLIISIQQIPPRVEV
jgi:uncharacterized protein